MNKTVNMKEITEEDVKKIIELNNRLWREYVKTNDISILAHITYIFNENGKYYI